MTKAREIHLKSRPAGLPQVEHFELVTVELPEPGAGEVLVRNRFMSVDPYMRGRMYDRPSYVPPFQVGKVLEGGAVGEVIASNDPSLKPGDLVNSMAGWREAFVAPASTLTKVPAIEGVPSQAYLGVMGMPGLTAWSGLTQIGEPKEGDTVFVSGGAGAVGSAVAQIAKIKGCHVVATAGTDEKCAWLKSVGVDHAINYKTAPSLLGAVREAAPRGIDVYFDNVGGEHLEVALELARPFARLVECGMIAGYNATEPAPGPRNIMYVVGKSLKMQGFIVIQYQHLMPQFLAEMGGWIQQGKVRWQETILEGIERAPEAFIGLFSGSNTGKMLVKL
ncbi:NADP-dependent oxidoreductase [Sandaracinobacter sp. RS1-74]|uniref:NADP-dependent oxidoreductase n=1 Tax=Sandaracinobacteroides sayramensis TaxID=2913411 RepID=UPI001EDC45AA|nr:NADP-dependent oxidoreductase [Sandaracinobacteroides sayramensis]MCG2840378.1 NADP-dependent oxidoreductase [Sandaracinobacteroides sayramensis]